MPRPVRLPPGKRHIFYCTGERLGIGKSFEGWRNPRPPSGIRFRERPSGSECIYLLTYSMKQSPSSETNHMSASQEFPAFYGARRFITLFTSARHLSKSWASSIHSMHPHPTSWRSILILSSHPRLGLPIGLFPSGFLNKSLSRFLLSPIRATFPPTSFFSIRTEVSLQVTGLFCERFVILCVFTVRSC